MDDRAVHIDPHARDGDRTVAIAARTVVTYCDAIVEAYDYGVDPGSDEPWHRPFATSTIRVLATALPDSFVRSLAWHLQLAAESGRGNRADENPDSAPFFRFVDHVVAATRELLGPTCLTEPPNETPVDRAPSVVPFGLLARLTTPHGIDVLRFSALAAVAACEPSPGPSGPPAPGVDDLRILEAIAGGEKVVDLAERLGYSQRTVYRRLARLWRDLGVGSTIEGIAAATRAGWLGDPGPEQERQTSANRVMAGSFHGGSGVSGGTTFKRERNES